MAFTSEDRAAIKLLRQTKGYGARRFLREFPHKNWTLGGLAYLIKKIDATGSIDRQVGSGRKRSARTEENINRVQDKIISQEGRPGTHLSQRKVAIGVGISQRSVGRIVKSDIGLKCLKKHKAVQLTEENKMARLSRCRKLLRKFKTDLIKHIFFTDEKLFTVSKPVNSQNDRLYTTTENKKRNVPADRLVQEKQKFSKSVMVSAGVSEMGCTDIYFIEPGVKIDGKYYRDVLLKDCLLPDMRAITPDFIFQQDSAPSHTARETVQLLIDETHDFIEPTLWPPNSPDLNPMDYGVWGVLQEKVYRTKINSLEELKQRIVTAWRQIEQSTIDAIIQKWRFRLHMCIAAGGGHFEHKIQ